MRSHLRAAFEHELPYVNSRRLSDLHFAVQFHNHGDALLLQSATEQPDNSARWGAPSKPFAFS